jgi:hypothetical protein
MISMDHGYEGTPETPMGFVPIYSSNSVSLW